MEDTILLGEEFIEFDEETNLLSHLTANEYLKVREVGVPKGYSKSQIVFTQGDPHEGIYIIESGTVKAFYIGPNGKEITLAYWGAGHFVGGPEIFGKGEHMWSGTAETDAQLLYLDGAKIRSLMESYPNLAIGIVEGLVFKGKCYSSLLQILGTRSVLERLASLFISIAENENHEDANQFKLKKQFTHDELAKIVGSTRQWITKSLDRFKKAGVIEYDGKNLVIKNLRALEDIIE